MAHKFLSNMPMTPRREIEPSRDWACLIAPEPTA